MTTYCTLYVLCTDPRGTWIVSQRPMQLPVRKSHWIGTCWKVSLVAMWGKLNSVPRVVIFISIIILSLLTIGFGDLYRSPVDRVSTVKINLCFFYSIERACTRNNNRWQWRFTSRMEPKNTYGGLWWACSCRPGVKKLVSNRQWVLTRHWSLLCPWLEDTSKEKANLKARKLYWFTWTSSMRRCWLRCRHSPWTLEKQRILP